MKISFYLFISLVAMVVSSSAGDAVDQVTIKGKVVYGPDRRPAPDVNLAIYRGRKNAEMGYGPTLLKADIDGRFSILRSPGTYYVRVTERPTLINTKYADYHMPSWGDTTEVIATNPTAPPPPVVIVLELAARVTGRAIRQDGTPLEHAIVGGQEPGSGGEIDKQGRFTILGLLTAVDQKVIVLPTDRRYNYERLVRVSGEDLKPGGAIDVGDVTFAPLPDKPNFSGTLSSTDGTPYTGLTAVVLYDKAGLFKFGANVREGKFEAAILPGDYRITTLSSDEGLPLGSVTIKEGQVAEVNLKIPKREKISKVDGKTHLSATSPAN